MRKATRSRCAKRCLQELRAHFKPEFLNRIDDIVIFHQLSREQIGQIIDVQLERLRQMLGERNITLVLEESAKELLMREGYDPSYGARPLKRAIQTLIQNPLAVKLLQGEILPGQTVRVSANGDRWSLRLERLSATAYCSEHWRTRTMSQQWNPLQDLMVLQDRMNRLFEDATQRRARRGSRVAMNLRRADWTPAADIYETETSYLIAIDLPGIDRRSARDRH